MKLGRKHQQSGAEKIGVVKDRKSESDMVPKPYDDLFIEPAGDYDIVYANYNTTWVFFVLFDSVQHNFKNFKNFLQILKYLTYWASEITIFITTIILFGKQKLIVKILSIERLKATTLLYIINNLICCLIRDNILILFQS